MWDSNAPLQLLKSMPKKLSKENLEKLQMVIDADKYKNSLISGFDLCGMYAPFCRGCKTTSIYPCAISYINMMRAQGMDVEIDAKPLSGDENKIFTPKPVVEEPIIREEIIAEPVLNETAVTQSVSEEEVTVQKNEEVQPAVQPLAVEEKVIEKDKPVSELPKSAVKRKIRIAVARKKI